MKKEELQKFFVLMGKLAIAFRENLTPEQGKIYLEYLQGFGIEEIEKAIDRAIRELKFFPKISELIEFIEEENQYLSNYEIKQLLWYSEIDNEITPEGQKRIEECIKQIWSKWNEEEAKKEEERKLNFEKRREELKKQFKIISGT
ncbi:MAG: hypothetical protein QW051_04525 [Candidatus Aenigmatarchaeota archaeon]